MWHIVGRPNGQRIRAWFKTKEAAQAEATERNLAMRKLGENAVALDAVLISRDRARRSDSLKTVWEDSQGRDRLLSLPLDRTSILHLRPWERIRWGKAIRCYQRALAINPTAKGTKANLAIALIATREKMDPATGENLLRELSGSYHSRRDSI